MYQVWGCVLGGSMTWVTVSREMYTELHFFGTPNVSHVCSCALSYGLFPKEGDPNKYRAQNFALRIFWTPKKTLLFF